MKFSIKDFFSKCDQIRSFLWIWSHLLKKFSMENFILSAALSFREVAILSFFLDYSKWGSMAFENTNLKVTW